MGLGPPADVPGLLYVRDLLMTAEESALVQLIDGQPWSSELRRRVQHYGWHYDYRRRAVEPSMRLGPLPTWAAELADRLAYRGLTPGLSDQVIVNEYVESQGISRHIDCVPCFADGIATISLLQGWEMVFTEEHGQRRKARQLLERRSVAVLTGAARYGWAHEIPSRLVEPTGLRRQRRLSITFRKVRVAGQ
jgi:alkylated DNA repair dioxygenase AlkB